MEHLRRVHPFEQNIEKTKSTTDLKSYFPRSECYSSTSTRKAQIDKSLARMVVLDLQPFSIVENDGFKNLIKTLDDKYVLPSRPYLKDVLVKNMYVHVHVHVHVGFVAKTEIINK